METRRMEKETWINTDHINNKERSRYLQEKIAAISEILKLKGSLNVYVQGHRTNPINEMMRIEADIHTVAPSAIIEHGKIDGSIWIISCTIPENELSQKAH